ncbi:MAG: type II toxin-antitoxin system HipA family toxin [Gammaproteobacteria bacterium]|nr:type II toxin-antitoxin system HipA family toxin [Gammaproteobacteria bacterium]
MARRRVRIPLDVYLNARLVGRLQREASGAIEFRYDDSWLGWRETFPVSLSLPLREDRYIGDPVIAVFDNLLPDNDDIRRRIAARSGAGGTDAYSLLAAIGRDCVGALQFLPEGSDPGTAGAVEARPINNEQIGEKLRNLEVAPLGIDDAQDFRLSITGAQDKTALLRWNGTWHTPVGTTATTHILKPQIGHRDGRDLTHSVENEHFCLRILAALGLSVANTEIVEFGGVTTLVIERFDRQWSRDGIRLLRVPQEDCCQAMGVPPTRKYQADGGPGMVDLLGFLQGSDDPDHDQLVFLKDQVAFWLLAASDGHAKNFSVFLHPRGGFRMTPLYDVMSAQHLLDNHQQQRKQMKLAMSVGENSHYHVHEILPRHFHQTAMLAGIPEAMVDTALDEISSALPAAIDVAVAQLPQGFPTQTRDAIAEGALMRLKVVTG